MYFAAKDLWNLLNFSRQSYSSYGFSKVAVGYLSKKLWHRQSFSPSLSLSFSTGRCFDYLGLSLLSNEKIQVNSGGPVETVVSAAANDVEKSTGILCRNTSAAFSEVKQVYSCMFTFAK